LTSIIFVFIHAVQLIQAIRNKKVTQQERNFIAIVVRACKDLLQLAASEQMNESKEPKASKARCEFESSLLMLVFVPPTT
jgi:hypothetical protein